MTKIALLDTLIPERLKNQYCFRTIRSLPLYDTWQLVATVESSSLGKRRES